ncbi:MAG TPA: hypothetical protein VFZ89_05735 [Solirubrobacteraceae bacterium]
MNAPGSGGKAPSWLAVAIAGAGGFLAGVLLVAILGGPKGVVRTTTIQRTATITQTVDGRVAVPDVVGFGLPEGKGVLEDAGFDVDVDADSLFGVVDEDNWIISEQDPRGGVRAAPDATVTVVAVRR